MTLKCLECNEAARWYVWYRDCSSPTTPSFPPANIAYNLLCDHHAIEEMKSGREGWHVACVKLVSDCFLPDGDRALGPERRRNNHVNQDTQMHLRARVPE